MFDEGHRDDPWGTGDDDGVERGRRRPAEAAVGLVDLDVPEAQGPEGGGGGTGECGHDFQGVDLGDQAGQNGGLVAGSGADLQHPVAGTGIDGLGHEGDDVRLGDRLFEPDGKRVIGVGFGPTFGRDEGMARHLGQGLEHEGVSDIAAGRAQLILDHVPSVERESLFGGGRRGGDGLVGERGRGRGRPVCSVVVCGMQPGREPFPPAVGHAQEPTPPGATGESEVGNRFRSVSEPRRGGGGRAAEESAPECIRGLCVGPAGC